ncbi:hypothetical protein F8O06_10185 [Pseudoclavibacter sp. CFCC 14310]|uniref:hypothetical protein n=1 Tax=Pseudoclavibacter sp. CFCC 14310 TaxID=2615180 RepID=UPI0013017EC1|nr:hypothetical protein [Pseudoclavibacter sp. CFCC 14310]KAB1644406.1 hypothetical protein F8O06_10185 [Pseudoclavibacter sp. CFCC 14310]
MHATSKRPSPAVYRRRRLAALVLLVVIVLLVVWAVSCATSSGRNGSNDADSAAQTSQTSEPQSTGSADPTSDDAAKSADAQKTESAASATPSADPGSVPTCDPGELSVSVKTEKGQYSFSQQPVFVYEVSNITSAPCSANVGTSQQELVVGSGPAEIWKSTPCIANPSDAMNVLEPGKPLTGTVSWDLSMNDGSACSKDRHASVTGTYWVQATIVGRSSEQYAFIMQ